MTGKYHKVPMGQNGLYLYMGYANFTTTGTTKEIDVPFKSIEGFSLTYTGTPAAADGPLSVNETVNTDTSGGAKSIKRDSSGNVTVTRVAGTTSGQGFCFVFWGK